MTPMPTLLHGSLSLPSLKAWTLLYTVLIFIVTMAGCGQKQDGEASEPEETEKVKAYKREVMDLHDEVMPMMGEIYASKKSLREKLQAPGIKPEDKQRLEAVQSDLEAADKGMRVWMREFSQVKTTGVSEDEALANLKVEMEKIGNVKKQMTEALEKAKRLQ